MGALTSLDWAVMAAYGVIVVAVGWWANRRQASTEDYLLGGRRMPWWAVGVSLIATSFSSAALIGGTGFGFSMGMSWLQLQIGDFLAVAGACVLFIPFFSALRLTTAYEYLERRFGVLARTLASSLFVLQTLLRAGLLVYGPALALAALLGWPIEWAIAVTAVAAVVYSAAGGIQAVVWTDVIQLAIVVFAVVYSVTLIAGDVAGGLGAVLEHASASGRLRTVSPQLDLATPLNVPGAVLAYGTLAFSVAGTNQQAVQRYLSCTDASRARRAALTGWAIGLGAVALTLFLGVCLHAWSELAERGSGFAGMVGERGGDSALPTFVAERLPAGVAGLVVAAIFAASMSSMDSAIHSLSTATLVDFVRRFRKSPLGDLAELRLARALTVVFGGLATVFAVVAAREGTLLLDMLVKWLGYFAGPLLGLFLLGVLSTRANETGAVAGAVAAGAVVATAVVIDAPGRLQFHALWLAPVACAITLVVGQSVSYLGTRPSSGQLDGLTLRRRGGDGGATRRP